MILKVNKNIMLQLKKQAFYIILYNNQIPNYEMKFQNKDEQQ